MRKGGAPGTSGISRRTALTVGVGLAAGGAAAAGGYGLVEAGTVPGKYALARALGACGSAPPPQAGPLPVPRRLQFWSAYRHRQVTMVVLVPAGKASPQGLGVIVALHGLGGDAAGTASSVARAMAAVPGPAGFAAITVDGGATYWHRRADGDDPIGMIIHEVLPRAAALGLRTDRIGIAGESMGGYGALLLAERLGGTLSTSSAGVSSAGTSSAGTSSASAVSRPVAKSGHAPAAAAVAAISPAIFASYTDARRADLRSFDGAADFARNDVLSGIGRLRNVPVYVACGDSDPFEPLASEFRERLRRMTGHEPAGGIEAGCHDVAFWERNLPAGLEFVAATLA